MHSIIFSSWTRTLQLLSRYLTEAQVPYVGIDGNCSLKERQKKLVEFESEDTPVLIMTTGTGGVGYVNSQPASFLARVHTDMLITVLQA
jgi:SNF2 family DNA or RNA helicase